MLLSWCMGLPCSQKCTLFNRNPTNQLYNNNNCWMVALTLRWEDSTTTIVVEIQVGLKKLLRSLIYVVSSTPFYCNSSFSYLLFCLAFTWSGFFGCLNPEEIPGTHYRNEHVDQFIRKLLWALIRLLKEANFLCNPSTEYQRTIR